MCSFLYMKSDKFSSQQSPQICHLQIPFFSILTLHLVCYRIVTKMSVFIYFHDKCIITHRYSRSALSLTFKNTKREKTNKLEVCVTLNVVVTKGIAFLEALWHVNFEIDIFWLSGPICHMKEYYCREERLWKV